MNDGCNLFRALADWAWRFPTFYLRAALKHVVA